MERIHVSVRARPLSLEDAKTSPWRISGNSISIPNQPSKFDFDRVFEEDCETADVYKDRTRDIVAAAVRGFNGTVFAYGQTSSGKTHTMRGSISEPGVIPLAVHDLFDIIHQETDREFLLRMSYMEIYNEEINDLLVPEHRKLQIHESVERGIFVAGLSENIVTSTDQVLQFMEFGESKRHIGETNMNVYSSRSHTIFRMIIESKTNNDNEGADMSCDAVRVSFLNLVDLAGSERAAKTGAEGVRLKEGSHINKSLMTLGTVIKKLSEGVESQGGHVPYRDSKLTRILQPALGGNANTAIICNITLAQIHADETKSSLQFASRALRVTNCAHVNEIMTDAALLKRQKKEIEELRAKLQGVHSEHQEEDILDLRNTLLKSELERERISLELEEEKRAQVERDKRLQEQEKRIENLSSMVLCANREDTGDVFKKARRRDTWCPGSLARKKVQELSSEAKEKTSDVKSSRRDKVVGPLLSFNKLVEEPTAENIDCSRPAVGDCTLPDPRALMHVTSRKKVLPRKRSSSMESKELVDWQEQHENLLLEFETYKTESDIQINYLTRKLEKADLDVNEVCGKCAAQNTTATSALGTSVSSKDADAILVIKQLQEKIAKLEMEKYASQENFDRVIKLAEEQTLYAEDKNEKLYDELLLAQEEVTKAQDALSSKLSPVEELDWFTRLTTEAQEIKLEFDYSKNLADSISSAFDDLLHFSSVMSNQLHDLRPTASQSSLQINSVIRSHENLQSCLRTKVKELENEKLLRCNQTSELQSRIEELSTEMQNTANELRELSEEHEFEKSELLCKIEMLERDISSLSTSSLAREKESIRKDLEKTKLKLKDTESKLKNAIQDKIKLEGEKSFAEREVKKLHGQKAILERDKSKQEAIIGRRHDSTVDRNTNIFDKKRTNASNSELAMQDEYKNLELLAFEMESTIASLEDQLAIVNEEKDEAYSTAEVLASNLQSLSDELQMSKTELSTLQDEVLVLRTNLEEVKVYGEKLESSLANLSEEKEELAMQLTESLLTMEEEKAIWLSKEKASVKVIEEKEKQHATEISLLYEELSKVETLQWELDVICKERDHLSEKIQKLEKEVSISRDNTQVEQLKLELKQQNEKLATFETNTHKDNVKNNIETAKLRMRLRGTQSKLDCFRVRYEELANEKEFMNKKFEEASAKLKKQLAFYGTELLNVKKQLVTSKGMQNVPFSST